MKSNPFPLLISFAILAVCTANSPGQIDNPCLGVPPTQLQMGTVTQGSNFGATTTPSSAGGCNNAADVWYQFTAPYSGTAQASTCAAFGSANYDTVINIWAGYLCPSPSLWIACNDDACGVLQSDVSFPIQFGAVYYIVVGGYNGAMGTFNLALFGTATPPPNDFCATATPIAVGGYADGQNSGATTGPDPLPACGVSVGRDMWYTFVAPSCGTFEARTCVGIVVGQALSFDTVIGVWKGTCGALVPVACNDDDPPCTPAYPTLSKVTFPGLLGTTYYISVSGYNQTVGLFRLSLSQTANSNPMALAFFNSGPGTLGYTVSNGPPGASAFTAITTAIGAYPNGWFYGIEITVPELVSEWLAGYPFIVPMGPSCGGSVTVGPFPGLPSGLTVVGVSLGLPASGPLAPIVITPPAAGAVP